MEELIFIDFFLHNPYNPRHGTTERYIAHARTGLP